jgi:hypothetical protein
MLPRIAELSGESVDALADPERLEQIVTALWMAGADLASPVPAPPSLVWGPVGFRGLSWARTMISEADMAAWGYTPSHGHAAATPRSHHPAVGVSLATARAYASDHGGRLPSLSEWQAATIGSAAGNHGMKWGTVSASGAFPAARSGLLDGWGNAWEWTDDGCAVGGSFASPPCPAPRESARIVGFRIVFEPPD